MRWIRSHPRTTARWLFVASLACAAPSAVLVAQSIPSRLSDGEFWRLVTEFSESNGYFRSDNFVSNETSYQWVIPDLLRTTSRGGVYLGVGPDQNFTYLVALKPRIAFVFDIRRQNMLTHLMYKALIEQSADRADFLSRLFARPRPEGLDTSASAAQLFAAYQAVPPDSGLARKTFAGILDRLRRRHGFTLSEPDTATIAYVYQTFVVLGPDITYNSNQARPAFGRGRMPSYAELQIETDSAGTQRGYMSSESNYRVLKELESNNLVVPLVGDFAGPKAIRSVGSYLKEHHLVVTAFYLSNVEQYLFQGDDEWRRFYQNVATLPLDSSSTFIRSVFAGMGYYGGGGGINSYMRARQMLASMTEQVRLFNEGKLLSYDDVIRSSR
ncbi:MAG TPA: hypothetical protein VL524_10020 [Gemmatimonadaceae bacterium]|jgi:hypothetical protein|nr:hypothetical protein [Gemmatimonadaceae bacterium]